MHGQVSEGGTGHFLEDIVDAALQEVTHLLSQVLQEVDLLVGISDVCQKNTRKTRCIQESWKERCHFLIVQIASGKQNILGPVSQRVVINRTTDINCS